MSERTKYNRRDFLKILGATGGLAAAGCSKELPEKIIPYVIQPDEIIPGIAAWYASTCAECSAGCGVLVRTREGRAVKLEGNKQHPINAGGLCAIGQSALQTLYDPDRVREPLARKISGGPFQPVGWEQAVSELADAVKNLPPDKDFVLLTGPVSGSLVALIAELGAKFPRFRHIKYELSTAGLAANAAELCFGPGVRTEFDLSAADVVVGFGADYLETWISPVEMMRARVLAAERYPKRFICHFEPRLSLTAANADHWVKNRPGSEPYLLLGLIERIASRSKQNVLPADILKNVSALSKAVDLPAKLAQSGVDFATLDQTAERLLQAESALVLAGGAPAADENALACAVLANVLNSALGSLGRTVKLHRDESGRMPSYPAVLELASQLESGKIGVVLICGINPVFSLPNELRFAQALSKAGFIAAAAVNLDETAALANVVLPLSTAIESWGDSCPRPGINNLLQPAMQPVFQTQGLADDLLALANKLEIKLEGIESFYDYIRREWRKRTGDVDFEKRWVGYLERGGEWSERKHLEAPLSASALHFEIKQVQPKPGELRFLAYPTVNFASGREANRPWLQELPNPITTAVWGSWLEMHPETAQRLGVRRDDVVRLLINGSGLELPVYITPYIHPDLVAAPLGQGHEAYGRYSNGIGANVLKLLPKAPASTVQQFTANGVVIRRTNATDEIVTLQGGDSQRGRGILRTVNNGDAQKEAPREHGARPDFPAAEEEEPNALGVREAPEQMYRQMDHPLYQWGMTIDLADCTGCSACVVACYAENNVPVVGKRLCAMGREMSWIRIERYFDGSEPQHGGGDDAQPVSGFLPMLCQHCSNAPCEPVCPVYATYHNEQGLNTMVYNRCVGTRYCANNCSYKVRRFNWFHFQQPEPSNWQLNPDVTVREVGVMEKCTFCLQRIREAENLAKDQGRPVKDGEVQPACASSCPTRAIKFGNLLDRKAEVSKESMSPRGYRILDQQLNTQPAITYLARPKQL